MTNTTLPFILSLLSCLFSLTDAWAAPELEKTVTSLTSELKKTGSYNAMTSFFHWPSLYQQIPAADLSNGGISSPEQLKQKVETFFQNPSRMLDAEWKKKDESLTPLQREILRDKFEESKALAIKQWKEENKKLSDARFDTVIREAKADPAASTAEVELTDLNDKAGKPWKLQFQKIEGYWYLLPDPALNWSQILAPQ